MVSLCAFLVTIGNHWNGLFILTVACRDCIILIVVKLIFLSVSPHGISHEKMSKFLINNLVLNLFTPYKVFIKLIRKNLAVIVSIFT